MSIMLKISMIIILLASFFSLYRLIKGPTFFDRVLAVNLIGTKVVVLLVLIDFLYDRPEFVDISLAYALINFVGTIAILKLKEKGRLD
ncbi:multisubunit sodium/proton antiporter, MrpF subunit [Calditerrivibrio nitroreducens DSM 19672]|uniref:Multisubunit sodium/proton antiporter, MrpF subunit n=2 Tax=Calditerrivibrio nitroreducens TaxID=477976 RepID=E4TF99_CALNY|nr:multisubunit sodium/proton antiporter, MrpF subunit [Calditerrivibrio nitroreducens DSM 19672]